MKAGFAVACALSGIIMASDWFVQPESLRQALTFHASFDGKVHAAHAAGDANLYWAPSLKQRADAKRGLPDGGEARHAPGAGRFGDALQFTVKAPPVVFYRGNRNMPYEKTNWSGTVSFGQIDSFTHQRHQGVSPARRECRRSLCRGR